VQLVVDQGNQAIERFTIPALPVLGRRVISDADGGDASMAQVR
jgi:hypothetical protein